MVSKKYVLLTLILIILGGSLSYIIYNYSQKIILYYVTYSIEQHCQSTFKDSKVKIEKIYLKTQKGLNSLTIHNLRLLNSTNQLLATIAKINFKIHWSIFLYKTGIEEIIAEGVTLVAENIVFNNKISDVSIHAKITQLFSSIKANVFISNINIENYFIEKLVIAPYSTPFKKTIHIDLQESENTRLNIEINIDKAEPITINFINLDINNPLFTLITKQMEIPFTLTNTLFTGSGKFFYTNNKFSKINLDFTSIQTKLPDFCTNINKCFIKKGRGNLIWQNKNLIIKNIYAFIDDAEFIGDFFYNENVINLSGKVRNMLATNVLFYWPLSVSIEGRKWFESNIKGGVIPYSSVLINTAKDSIKLEGQFQNVILDATPSYKNLYISQAKGKFSLTENKIAIKVDSALTKQLPLQQLKINVTKSSNSQSLNLLKVEGKTNSAVLPLLNWLSITPIDPFLPYIKTGKAKVEFNISKDLDDANENLTINGNFDIDNFSAEPINKVFYLKNWHGKGEIQTNNLVFNAEGKINDEVIKISHTQNLLDNNSLSKVKGNFKIQNLIEGNLLPEALKIFSGNIYTDFNVEQSAGQKNYNGEAGLFNNLKINNTTLTTDNESKVTFEVSTNEKESIINSLNLQTPELKIHMQGVVGENTNLQFERLQYKNTDVKAIYSVTNLNESKNKKILNIQGEKISLQDCLSLTTNTDSKTINFSDLDLDIITHVKLVTLYNNVKLYNANAKLTSNYYESFLEGQLENQYPLKVLYNTHGLKLTTNNAGYLLAGLDLTTSLKEGDLRLELSNPELRYKPGFFVIQNFYLVEAPILATILSLASISLQSIAYTLAGEGIFFHNLTSAYTLNNRIIDFEESWFEGPSLGISFLGPVNLEDKSFVLYGNVVPIYNINALIWKLPLIGPILTGGQGRGVMTIDYTLRKEKNKAIITQVHPITTFTPKVLQKLLDIFS